MNEILLFIEIIVIFSLVVLSDKLFKRNGLIVWVSIASVIANIEVIKNIELFGLSATLGNVLFASNFLATDILTIKYGKKYAELSINIGLFSVITLLISTQLMLLFIPSSVDIVHSAMTQLFAFSPRICISSIFMYYLSNKLDIYVFTRLEQRKLWIRNNLATILCNCAENIGFTLLAFTGIFDFKTIITMIISTSIIEIIIALCDTPFLYLARKL